jgi:hypothetical protein
MRLSKQQIEWWNVRDELRFSRYGNDEYEEATPPMTVRGSGREANIADLMSAFRGAILIATATNKQKAELLGIVYNQLLRDMRVDPEDIRHISTKTARSDFSTQTGFFVKCAPFFKAYFDGCNEVSMRYLLIKSRLFFAENREWARQSWRLRNRSKKSDGPVPRPIRIAEELESRLWPLDGDIYEGFSRLYIRRRLGPKSECSLFMAYSDYGTKLRLTRHGCEIVKAKHIGGNVSWSLVVPGSEKVRSDFFSPISNLAKIERALAKGATLRIRNGKIMVP